MTEEKPPSSSGAATMAEKAQSQKGSSRAFERMEARLAQAEAQIVALQDRVAELDAAGRAAKQRGLWLRVFLLVAALAAFFVIRSMKSGAM